METLSVPAELESLEKVASWVVRAAAEAGLDRAAAYQLRLAVDEIATNIISYAYGKEGGEFTLRADVLPARLTVVIEDSGIPFDPLARQPVDEEDLSLPLEERQMGGLGIYLVLQGVDSFSYERVDGRNRNILGMNR